MSSSSMPPPPTPFAHRRTPRLITKNLSLSPPASPASSECLLRRMSKGATFHYSSSPSTVDDPVLSIPHLTRRSPTCSQSTLTSWLSEKEDVAKSIADFEQTFSGARGKKSSSRRTSAQNFEQQVKACRGSLPSDEGLGSSISPASDKGLAKSFERALDLLSNRDSGLGTSVSDSVEKVVGDTSEEDGLVKDLIQGWIARCVLMCEDIVNHPTTEADSPESTSRRARPREGHPSSRTSTTAITRSIAPPTSRTAARHPPLSPWARNKIKEYIITPILREDRFEILHPLVTALGCKANKAIRCLRDLEQSLIFQPLTLAISRPLYRVFGEFTVQLVVDTYQHLPESDQRRAADRPYDNGYFLDLVQQVNRLASHIGSSNRAQQAGPAEDDEMAYSIDDEVTLEGGLGETGNEAELVRWKNGKGISLRTGLPYVPTPGIKRSSSDALDEDVARSMARRKKGYIPEIVEMKCHDKSCDKIFTRKCDLAKHEKTHSRPFKCPEESCKYHELGLPTEKERERHYNDKHAKDPLFYKCEFCEFRTKRESNCKQHQEKKHGWHYERAKGKDKATSTTKMTPAQTPRTPSMDYSPSPAVSIRTWDDGSSIAGSIAGSASMTPFEQPLNNFDNYQSAPVTYSNPIFPRTTPSVSYNQTDDFDFNATPFNQNYQPAQAYISPTNTTPITPHNMMSTPITPAYSNITEPSPYDNSMDITMDCNPPTTWNSGLPTPGSFLQPHSRNPSISDQSPMIAVPSGQSFGDAPLLVQEPDFPSGDFSLFGGEGSNAFSNPAAATATLFPGGPEIFASLDNDPMLDPAWNDSDFIDYE
ncbi:uncharacterized protein Z518_08679 [Rhinocladiella mackenziei CBS 650.93]|uniref:Rhinocladiella mackenziei CBS 650.93 unplaced genomic scaffold supercont1.6, whole genome shotgun sequence n=1 Tax=Rhinocladiella mackenziei CBS 650.93 TaxID=1442369 RepID=A0A0D2FL91_9EURO|nr:uncharacterized protein Z518_08679 [Rhinocladiella mackenziei CBS 650.93]KIX02737.1 hypothetical protein Z518_08679 [Rhinocladiella mackenziei CBS 650.93]